MSQHSQAVTTDLTSLNDALSELDGEYGFGWALLDLASLSVAAKERIGAVAHSEKKKVLDECLHEWREKMVELIRSWAPKFFGAAIRFGESSPYDWTRQQMQAVINKRLRTPDMKGAVAFWVTTACGEDVLDKHGKIRNKELWRIPSWLRSQRQEILDYWASLPEDEQAKLLETQTIGFIREEQESVHARLKFALNEAISHLRLERVSQTAPQPNGVAESSVTGLVRLIEDQGRELRQSVSGLLGAEREAVPLAMAADLNVVDAPHRPVEQAPEVRPLPKPPDTEYRGQQAAVFDEELRTLAKANAGRRVSEDELRTLFPRLALWEAISKSETLKPPTRSAFFAVALDVHKQEDRFAFIGQVMGGASGATAYDWYKKYRKIKKQPTGTVESVGSDAMSNR